MSKLSEHVLEQIKDKGIKPKPRWYFVLMNIFLIASLVFAILVGGMVMGLIFLKLSHLEWGYVRFIGDDVFPRLWEVLPLIWVIMLLLVLLMASRVFEMIEGSYKYSHLVVLGASILLSTILGGVVYASRLSDLVELSLRSHLDFYEQMESMAEQKFELPDKGLLPGRVIEIRNGGFTLEDLRDDDWDVTAPENLIQMVHLENGQMVMVIGEKTDDDAFIARDLKVKRAFGGMRMMKPKTLLRMQLNNGQLPPTGMMPAANNISTGAEMPNPSENMQVINFIPVSP
jgi:hypothetical protein